MAMSAANPVQDSGPMFEARPREPSMEEILASIRRIIADDQALFSSSGGLPLEGARLAPVLSSQAAGYAEPVEESPAPPRPAAATISADAEPPLVSPATDQSVAAAFNALVATRFVQNADAVAALTRELLRPMVKAWLDKNLPAMVERLVRAEIERVARGA